MDENFGVIDGNKSYTHHAIARVLGVADRKGQCSRFVLRNLLKAGLCFVPVGRLYIVNGHNFNLWIQKRAAPWDTWKEHGKDSADEEGESVLFDAGGTPKLIRGRKPRKVSVAKVS